MRVADARQIWFYFSNSDSILSHLGSISLSFGFFFGGCLLQQVRQECQGIQYFPICGSLHRRLLPVCEHVLVALLVLQARGGVSRRESTERDVVRHLVQRTLVR